MGLYYKVDVLAALKAKGHSTYQLRKGAVLSEGTIQKLRQGRGVSWDVLDTLCDLLDCQPGDLLAYEKDPPG